MKLTTGWVAGKTRLVPGIGAVLGQTPDVTLRQILITRKHKTAGFILFDYQPRLADEWLPMLRMGATAEPAEISR